jgi:phosphatidate cytidylyltransferase
MSMSNLAARVLFGLAAVPVVLAVIWIGDWALAGFIAVLGAIAGREFFRIGEEAGYRPLSMLGTALAGVIPLVVHAYFLGLVRPTLAWVTLTMIAVFSVAVWARLPEKGRPLGAAAITLIGAAYTGGFFSFAYAIRYHPYAIGAAAGTALLFLPILLVWATDTGGYFVGRAIGRRKLHPGVSPGKTIEGAIGAVLLAVLICWPYVHYVLVPQAQLALSPLGIFIFAVAISVAVQLGDLFESLIKREAGVKDSSNILPGHGGMLDRLDGMLFALPLAYLMLGHLLIPAPR